jgi:hypothetical protein
MTIDRIRTAESNEIAQQSNKLEATANILPTDLPGGLDLPPKKLGEIDPKTPASIRSRVKATA